MLPLKRLLTLSVVPCFMLSTETKFIQRVEFSTICKSKNQKANTDEFTIDHRTPSCSSANIARTVCVR